MKDNKEISLFLDTATKSLSIGAIYGKDKDIVNMQDSKKALERTHLGIKLLGDEMGFSLSDVDSFYCLLGPGSNTGIRLGLTIPRTIYAFNPNIKIFGIETTYLFLANIDNGIAVLSDRGGNLFVGKKENGNYSFSKLNKTDIKSLPVTETIIVEDSDLVAINSLEGYNLKKINVITLMMNNTSLFTDFSNREEEFLPEYIQKI